MKKAFLFLLLSLITGLTFGQGAYLTRPEYGWLFNRIRINPDGTFALPRDTAYKPLATDIGAITFNTGDNALYTWNGAAWVKQGGAGSTITASNGLTKTGNDIALGGTYAGVTALQGADGGYLLFANSSVTTGSNFSQTIGNGVAQMQVHDGHKIGTFGLSMQGDAHSSGRGLYMGFNNQDGTIPVWTLDSSGIKFGGKGFNSPASGEPAYQVLDPQFVFNAVDSTLRMARYKNNIGEDSVLSTDVDGMVKMKAVSSANIYNTSGILNSDRTLTGMNRTYRLTFDSLLQFHVNTSPTGFAFNLQGGNASLMDGSGAGLNINLANTVLSNNVSGNYASMMLASGSNILFGATSVEATGPLFSVDGAVKFISHPNNVTEDSVLSTDVNGVVKLRRVSSANIYNTDGILSGHRILTGKNNTYRLTLDSMLNVVMNTRGSAGTGFVFSQQSVAATLQNQIGTGYNFSTGAFTMGTGLVGSNQAAVSGTTGIVQINSTLQVVTNTKFFNLVADSTKFQGSNQNIQFLGFKNNAARDSVLSTDANGYLRMVKPSAPATPTLQDVTTAGNTSNTSVVLTQPLASSVPTLKLQQASDAGMPSLRFFDMAGTGILGGMNPNLLNQLSITGGSAGIVLSSSKIYLGATATNTNTTNIIGASLQGTAHISGNNTAGDGKTLISDGSGFATWKMGNYSPSSAGGYSANVTLNDDNGTVLLTGTGGFTVTLPSASSMYHNNQGKIYDIINACSGSVTISAVQVFSTPSVTTIPTLTSWRIQSNGTGWVLLSRSN